MRAVCCALILLLLLIVGFIRRCPLLLALALLSSLELLVVDSNSSVHILIERLNVLVGFNKLVLNVVLKPIIETPLKYVLSPLDSKRKLSEP